MRNLYIFDVDGTLSDTTHRQHFVQGTPRDWQSFNEQMQFDAPRHNVVDVYLSLQEDPNNVMMMFTGRPEAYRQVTIDWVSALGIRYERLLMRPEGNYDDDCIIKKAMLDSVTPTFGTPVMIFDDRNRVVDMWRNVGMTCSQVALGDF